MQSTPDVKAASREAVLHEEESVWDIWPYCWAIDGWDIACENFETRRANFAMWKLARFNRRALEKFYRRNWRARFLSQWQRAGENDERDLKLV
jgi:uncharacterized protein YbdZ (MbtH family)